MAKSTILKWQKEQVVFKEGVQNSYLYRIKRGRFRVERNGILLNRLETGAMFGEMSFLGTHTSASIICDEDESELWMLEISLARKLFASDPDLFRTFYQYLATILAKRLKNAHPAQSSTPTQPASPRPAPQQPATPASKSKIVDEDSRLRKRFHLDESEIIIKGM